MRVDLNAWIVCKNYLKRLIKKITQNYVMKLEENCNVYETRPELGSPWITLAKILN